MRARCRRPSRGNELITLSAVVVGCAIVLLFFWIEKKQPKPTAV